MLLIQLLDQAWEWFLVVALALDNAELADALAFAGVCGVPVTVLL